jgi:hypothetical protein
MDETRAALGYRGRNGRINRDEYPKQKKKRRSEDVSEVILSST